MQPEKVNREIITIRSMSFMQDLIFKAWTDPSHLRNWWGPKGFTNTFHEFDLRPEGHWRYTMHGPDGKDYFNHSQFKEIIYPRRFVFEHLEPMHRFLVTASFEAENEKTKVTFSMLFESVEECNRVKNYVIPANEENFDRLETELRKMVLLYGDIRPSAK